MKRENKTANYSWRVSIKINHIKKYFLYFRLTSCTTITCVFIIISDSFLSPLLRWNRTSQKWGSDEVCKKFFKMGIWKIIYLLFKKNITTFFKFCKDNTALSLLIIITRGTIFSYMNNKVLKVVPMLTFYSE